MLSVSILYTRLSHSRSHFHGHSHHRYFKPLHQVNYDFLLSDSGFDDFSGNEDTIDALDVVEEQQQEEEVEEEDEPFDQIKVFGHYFFDHITGVVRRAFNKRSIEEWDDGRVGFFVGSDLEDRNKAAFGSDDVPVDEQVRKKAFQVMGIEDALLLKMGRKISPLREGWGDWFDKKADFLRKDKIFRSNLESLNPLNNPMLQDPDGIGVTGLNRGDRIVHKLLLSEFKRVPFLGKKKGLGISRELKLQGNRDMAKVLMFQNNNGNVDRISRGWIKKSVS